MKILSAAVVRSVMEPAELQRSHFSSLDKVHFDLMLRSDEVSELTGTLKQNWLALPSRHYRQCRTGLSFEHILLSASNIHNGISFDELLALLGVTPEQTETRNRQDDGEKQMSGSIDQMK
ncbi:MAG: hypothetical protein J3Q66DRAFT_1977 [Benniella sp.]|nr:MAG: hypothetical protein J3Q66DRAFT_1977 [Benniella sp.]